MGVSRYKTSNLTKHIWLGLAVFFLVFTSNPVKKFIQLTLFGQATPIETSTGERLTNSYVKVCTIVDRHQLASKTVKADQSTDTDLIILFSTLVSFALLYFVRTTPQQADYHQHQFITSGAVPLYLSVRRLQV